MMAASETYIQMWLELGRGKFPLSEALRNNLIYYDNYIKEHPGIIEFIRQRRVDTTSVINETGTRKIMGFQYIIIEADAIEDYEKILKMNYYKLEGKYPEILEKTFRLQKDKECDTQGES